MIKYPLLFCALISFSISTLLAQETVLISKAYDGGSANGSSFYPTISGNGKFIAYSSVATNLIEATSGNPVEDFTHLYLHDFEQNKTDLISKSATDELGNAPSWIYSSRTISYDGNFIIFSTYASNFSNKDKNNSEDGYLLNREQQSLARVTLRSDGTEFKTDAQATAVSNNGRFVVFQTPGKDPSIEKYSPVMNVYLRDLKLNKTLLISRDLPDYADGGCYSGGQTSYSPNLKYILFTCLDRESPNQISKLNVFKYDRVSDDFVLVSKNKKGLPINTYTEGLLDKSGKKVVLDTYAKLSPNDKNIWREPYLVDLKSKRTNALLPAFTNNLTANITAVSMTPNARFLTLRSSANLDGLDDGDDIVDQIGYRFDRVTKQIIRLARSFDGTTLTNAPTFGYISALGNLVVFESGADQIVSEDSNGYADIYLSTYPKN